MPQLAIPGTRMTSCGPARSPTRRADQGPNWPSTRPALATVPERSICRLPGDWSRHCDNGPQGALVTRDYGVCPGKLALIEHGRLTTIRSTGPLCFEVINEGGVRPGAPGWKDPRLWGTRGRYDAASGTIELVTMQDGRPEPTCAKRLHVR